jgi:dolichol-phosphate mannosyltransferase
MLIIPTYNEAPNIEKLVARIRAVVGNIPVLFIDDNSPDGTADTIRRLQECDSNIHLVVRPGKLGLGSAYIEGFRRAIEGAMADFVIEFDADLSHPTEALPGIISLLSEYDVVVGSRYIPGGSVVNWNRWRRLISWGANVYARILTGVPIYDLTAGCVAYRLRALEQIDLSAIESNGYAFQIEIKCLLHRAGAKITEHPITFTERQQGRSKLSGLIVAEGIVFPLRRLLSSLRKRERQPLAGV